MARALTLCAALLLLAVRPVGAASGSISDCEKITQADAYNRCLAQFGPAAHMGATTRQMPAGAEGGPAAGRAEGRRRKMERRNGIVTERRGGRVRAIIDLGKR